VHHQSLHPVQGVPIRVQLEQAVLRRSQQVAAVQADALNHQLLGCLLGALCGLELHYLLRVQPVVQVLLQERLKPFVGQGAEVSLEGA